MLGRHHPLLRRIRALRRDARLRRSEGVFLAEGIHLAREAIEAEAAIEALLRSPRLSDSAEGRELLRDVGRRALPCFETSDALLAAAQDARSPQPIVTLVRRAEHSPAELQRLLDAAACVVVLVDVQDPGNFGSILRSADAAASTVCFATAGCADPHHPRTVRATMGSVFRVPVVRQGLDEIVQRLRRGGFSLAGADPRGAVPYHEADLTGRLAFLLGGEGSGLPAAAHEALDLALRIPMRAGVESLSVGAAAAVLLFEAARQRRP